jgi:glycosyltransferase involved in cell wall biosynthesis
VGQSQWQRLGVRLQARLSRLLYQYLRFRTPALLGYGVRRLQRFAQTHRADLTIVHSEAGLWVGQQLLRQGYGVGVDFEDWFSQDLLPSARRQRPGEWIADLEADLLQHCRYRLTPSQAMAAAMAIYHQVPPPTVVYNVFPLRGCRGDDASDVNGAIHRQIASGEHPVRRCPPRLSFAEASGTRVWPHPVRLHWFSQTIGPGRGLERLFAALPHLTQGVEVHLRGHCSAATQTWLTQQIPPAWIDQVHLHPTVANDELPARIAEYDIGLALEQTHPPSRNLTITNKLFQYLQAGLAVIATDTAGQREVFRQWPEIGYLVDGKDAIALATAIDSLASNPTKLQSAQMSALQAAQSQFCWELTSQKLLAAAKASLSEVEVDGRSPQCRESALSHPISPVGGIVPIHSIHLPTNP